MDENLPEVFRESNLFLLPVRRKEYAIVRGIGYNQETIADTKPASQPEYRFIHLGKPRAKVFFFMWTAR